MKTISKNLYDACEFYLQNQGLSLTKAAAIFSVDRHSIKKHLIDYKSYSHFFKDQCYLITEEELIPVNYFLADKKRSLTEVCKKFKIGPNTIKTRMKILGIEYQARRERIFNLRKFQEIDTEEKAYWLGFILADGYLNEDRNFLNIKLGIVDEKHLEKFATFMEEKDYKIKYDIGGAYTRDNPVCYIDYNSKELVADLKKWGIFQGKSGKEVPIDFIDDNLKKSYIRGLIDGDGCVKNNFFSYVGSIESCQYVKDYFSKWIDYKENCNYIYKKGTIFTFCLKNQQVNNALKEIYLNSSIYLDRKYEVVKNFD